MDAYKYELKKFCGHKFFWYFFIVLFLLNIWTVREKIRNQPFRSDSVKEVYQDLAAIPPEECSEWLKNKKENIGAELGYTGNPLMEKELFAKLTKELQQIQNYEGYLEEIEKKAGRMTSVIFSDEQSYAYRSAQKTPPVFEKLKGLNVTMDISEGVILAVRTGFTDFCMFLLIIATVYFLISEEQKYHLFALLKSTYQGRKSVIRAKIVTGAGVILFSVLVYYGGNYLIAYYLYGFGDLARPIQSVTMLYESPFLLSVGTYLVLYLAIKFVVCLVILLLTMLTAQYLRSSVSVLAAAAGAGAVEYLLTVLLPVSSGVDFLKYINMAEYLKVYPLLEKYHNLNFFNYPLNAVAVFAIFIPVLSVLLYIGNCKRFRRTSNVTRHIERKGSGRFGKKAIAVTDIFVQELYKLCVVYKALILGGALLIAAIILSIGDIEYSDAAEDVYRSYILQNEGSLTREKIQSFQSKKAEYDTIFNLTPEESGLTADEIRNKKTNAMYTYSGFMKAYSQVQYVLNWNMQHPEDHIALVYETGYEILLGERSRLYTGGMILLCMIAAIYAGAVSLGREYDLQVMNLLRSARYGRGNLLRNKFAAAIFFVFVTAVLIRIPMLGQIGSQYPMEFWNVGIQSLRSAAQITQNYTIAEYVILVSAGQFTALLLLVLAVMALSAWVKDSVITIVISAALFILPLILDWNGFAAVHTFSFNGLLQTHRLLQSSKMTLVCYAAVFLTGLPAVCIWRFYKTCRGSR